ncbi:MAG TPA: outer membrane beta-barrel protein [Vicinamibacterales bacterium]|nr:outer membrane beta-barrel protein [Vicinamibacterales bacterium]
MRLPVFICALVALAASPATAQQDTRGYVQAIGGVATTAATDAILGGGAAIRATRRVEVFGELGRLRNGIWTSLDDELAAAGAAITQQIAAQFGTDTPASFDARVPVWYGLAGARVRGPRLGWLETYAEAGIGFARLRPEVRLEVAGERLDAEAGRLLTLDDERSELLSALGGGVAFRLAGPIRVEAGYRYARIHGDQPVNVNRLHAGLGYAF